MEPMGCTWHKSTCPYCGIGCGLLVGVEKSKVVAVRGLKSHPANHGHLCRLAANLPGVFAAEDRLTEPLIRQDGTLSAVDWQQAISHVAGTLSHVLREHGPGAIAFYGEDKQIVGLSDWRGMKALHDQQHGS